MSLFLILGVPITFAIAQGVNFICLSWINSFNIIVCRHWMCVTVLANFNFISAYAVNFINHSSHRFWKQCLGCRNILIHKKWYRVHVYLPFSPLPQIYSNVWVLYNIVIFLANDEFRENCNGNKRYTDLAEIPKMCFMYIISFHILE